MKKILLATALVAFAPALLLADEPDHRHGPGRGEEIFKRWDTNNDGTISRDEAQASGAERVGKMFDKLDTNKDGQLTQDELRQGREDRMAAMKAKLDEQFKSADKDGDGSLSKDEATQSMPRLARHFDAIDANKDGLVSRDELAAHHQSMRHGG
jgi:Ca2+-binding EF-hand superfamily protein